MKRVVMLCVFSAVIGAVIARYLPVLSPVQTSNADKQAADHSDGSSFDSGNDHSDGQYIPVGSPNTADDGGIMPARDSLLTPDERVNVSVYEKVNRSVVNINTKTVREDPFTCSSKRLPKARAQARCSTRRATS